MIFLPGYKYNYMKIPLRITYVIVSWTMVCMYVCMYVCVAQIGFSVKGEAQQFAGGGGDLQSRILPGIPVRDHLSLIIK